MKRKTLLITAACLALSATVAIHKVGSARQPRAVAPAANFVELLQTDLVTVTRQDLQVSLPLSGSLRALNQTSLKAKVSGEVKAVLVREGEAVRVGQVIARIDPTEYEARVAQARGQMLAMQAQFQNSRQTLERNRELVGKGFISKTAFDKFQSDLDIARANLDAAQGGLGVAQKALADTVVSSPLNGMIAARAAQPGEKVSPDTRLVDVVDLRVLELEAPVPMADVARASVGQAVELDVEGAGRFTGKLVRINPAVMQGTRSIMVYIRVENANQLLRGGMFARGTLALGQRAGVVAVPASAVRTEGERVFVYAIDRATLAERPVQLGIRDEASGLVEIVSGLDAGAEIVRIDLGALHSGSQVRRIKV
ncbi:efflux RND transporter periplasmic adaptor subunit [Cupriavidus consociatus]|uniref:efflux RND transporter periplasmic adaptor subunit n=1 Tax=Cupriavidus consociatus TaxID=2821357 RepID=UPI001AE8EBE2|nr:MULTISPECIES: efflux RND transporter periplasmic adaptor subunit [unclassified Cupriavidus]MBP0625475.1 efflux RND transporter periplasmic adaptor subunit [Cupriavidus sp. LEh25]MDK2662218.1 efflux RND transporter periplasmic adaptor subunit [Cupriavidus sp. LEh21]